jgi:hypothetical protein
MSAIDPKDFGGSGLEYYRQDDSGEWVVESVGTGPLTYQYATSIAIHPDGTAHITYYDQNENDLALASRDDSGWSITAVDSEGDTGMFSSLVIDGDGRFHVSYFQKTGDNSGMVRYATRGPEDPSWETRTVGELHKLVFGHIGARNITSMALDSKGNPWIAYTDEKSVMLAAWDGSTWKIDMVIDAGSADLGQLVLLELDSQDRPHLVYFEVTNKRKLDGTVMYALGIPN